MSASVHTLPVWKRGATPAEWLQELAAMALANPERFGRIVVVYEEMHAEGYAVKLRDLSYGHPHNSGIIATLEQAKLRTYDIIRGREP